MDTINAQLRAVVYEALEDADTTKPPLCDEILTANLLIVAYLQKRGYKAASATLLRESGMRDTEDLASVCATDIVRARLSKEPRLAHLNESWLEAMVRERL